MKHLLIGAILMFRLMQTVQTIVFLHSQFGEETLVCIVRTTRLIEIALSIAALPVGLAIATAKSNLWFYLRIYIKYAMQFSFCCNIEGKNVVFNSNSVETINLFFKSSLVAFTCQ